MSMTLMQRTPAETANLEYARPTLAIKAGKGLTPR
jgi:hypothetical protein